MNAAEKALELLNNGAGWLQGAPSDGRGRRCLVTAVCEVDPKSSFLLDDIVSEQFPDRIISGSDLRPAAQFNDDLRTSFTDIALVLEKASVRLEELA